MNKISGLNYANYSYSPLKAQAEPQQPVSTPAFKGKLKTAAAKKTIPALSAMAASMAAFLGYVTLPSIRKLIQIKQKILLI